MLIDFSWAYADCDYAVVEVVAECEGWVDWF